MNRSPLFYIGSILFVISAFIKPAKDFFDIGLFNESPVVLFMGIVFIPFSLAFAMLTRKQFLKSL